jgi:putative transposase
MARLPRLTLAGYPHHVVQRGNNRQSICLDTADFQTLNSLLYEHARKFNVSIHAYVLMGNHFHLLATPPTDDALSKMMQSVGRSYVRYFNDRTQRTGTLWEGRYKSTVIEADSHLLTCMVYMDLNPVRAGLAAYARDYPWSSHGHYCGLHADKLITPHALVWNLGNTPFAREAAYSQLVHNGISQDQQMEFTEAVLLGWVLGGGEFISELQKKTPRRLSKKSPGRPSNARS